MSDASDILDKLPTRLRAARQKMGLSLEAVARLSGVSRSMISQIERGDSSPTIATLWNLTRALQLDIADLLEDGARAARVEVVRDGMAPTIDNRGSRCRLRILSAPEDAGRTEVYDLRLGANAALDSQPHRRGAREQIVVLEGRINVRSGAAQETLSPGDTAGYAADVPHMLEAGPEGARAILIVTNA